jgi:anaerobic ribonucleoside-triphosphate reductase
MPDESAASGPKMKAVRTEVYSRVVGYYRPVQDWNKGKQEEFAQREYVELPKEPEPGGQA